MVTVPSLKITRLVMIWCTLIALPTHASIGVLLIARYTYLFDLVTSTTRALVVAILTRRGCHHDLLASTIASGCRSAFLLPLHGCHIHNVIEDFLMVSLGLRRASAHGLPLYAA